MNKKLFLLPLLALPFLSGCSNGPTDQDVLKGALENTVLLMRIRNGRDIAPSEDDQAVRYAEVNEYFLALKDFDFKFDPMDTKSYPIHMDWSTTDTENWIFENYAKDDTRLKVKPIYKENQSYTTSLDLTMSTESGATLSAKWNFEIDPYIAPDLTEYTYASAQTIIDTYITTPSDPLVASGSKLYTYGTVTAKVENPYRGIWVGDGNYGVMIYGADDTLADTVEIGDKVIVAGVSSPYSGTYEINVSSSKILVIAPDADAHVQALTTPVVLNGNEMLWTAWQDSDGLNNNAYCKIGSTVQVTGATFKSLTGDLTKDEHATITFTLNGVDIKLYMNKNEFRNGSEEKLAIKAVVDQLVANETVCNLKGIIGQYNKTAQITPAFFGDSIVIQTAE